MMIDAGDRRDPRTAGAPAPQSGGFAGAALPIPPGGPLSALAHQKVRPMNTPPAGVGQQIVNQPVGGGTSGIQPHPGVLHPASRPNVTGADQAAALRAPAPSQSVGNHFAWPAPGNNY